MNKGLHLFFCYEKINSLGGGSTKNVFADDNSSLNQKIVSKYHASLCFTHHEPRVLLNLESS